MAKKRDELSDAEQEVLKTLWELGSGTVREVCEALDRDGRSRVYTTVLTFLAFHSRYSELAERLSHAVAAHATPVGSGTVARTKRIPVEQRAEAAVIAWMRHQTTGYDDMRIARVKGKRREVRQHLAGQSKRLLGGYRSGSEIDTRNCPLAGALARKDEVPG